MPLLRATRLLRLTPLAILLVAVVGCQSREALRYRAVDDDAVAQLQLIDVPLEHQVNDRACGAAALAMVLKYYDKPVPQQRIVDVCDKGQPGGLAAGDLKELAQREGLYAFLVNGQPLDLFKYLRRGIPLVVARRAEYRRFLQPPAYGNHYMVATGYTPGMTELVMNDPERGRVRVNLEDFLADWAAAQRFLLVIAPRTAAAPPSEAPPLQ